MDDLGDTIIAIILALALLMALVQITGTTALSGVIRTKKFFELRLVDRIFIVFSKNFQSLRRFRALTVNE